MENEFNAGAGMTRSTVALLLCSLGSLIACDGEPTTVAQAEISGTISYRERIELPRGATVRIVAEDVSRADAPATILAEDDFATNGRQVPIPFVLSYDPASIIAANSYGLRAQIRDSEGELLWATGAPQPIITGDAPANDIELNLVRVSPPEMPAKAGDGFAAGTTAVFDCSDPDGGDFDFVMRTGPGEIAVWLPLRFNRPYLVLGQIRAASGARYEGDGVTVWTHADEALLIVDGEQFGGCALDRARSIWEHAKLSGVDFRAVGNEPGWHLEIRNGDRLQFVYDYGQSEVIAPAPDPLVEAGSRQATYDIQTDTYMLTVRIHGSECIDSMSGEMFESSVVVDLDGKTFQGCGRALH
jgi:putative lipoprotein